MKLVVVTEPQAEGGRMAAMVSRGSLGIPGPGGQGRPGISGHPEELVVEEVVHAT